MKDHICADPNACCDLSCSYPEEEINLPQETIQRFLDEMKDKYEGYASHEMLGRYARTALPKAGKVIETMLSAFKNHLDAEWDCMNFGGTLLEKEIARIIEEKA